MQDLGKDIGKLFDAIIMATRGYDAWQELLRLRAEIRRKRKEAERARQLARQKFWENLWLYGGILVLIVGGFTLLFVVIAALDASGTLDSWLGRS